MASSYTTKRDPLSLPERIELFVAERNLGDEVIWELTQWLSDGIAHRAELSDHLGYSFLRWECDRMLDLFPMTDAEIAAEDAAIARAEGAM